MRVHIIHADGREEFVTAGPRAPIAPLIGATTLDGFRLRDRRYVYVDDNGQDKNLPVNAKATELYRSACKPGAVHVIRGDVAVVDDERAA